MQLKRLESHGCCQEHWRELRWIAQKKRSILHEGGRDLLSPLFICVTDLLGLNQICEGSGGYRNVCRDSSFGVLSECER